jgi:hypothetical protein
MKMMIKSVKNTPRKFILIKSSISFLDPSNSIKAKKIKMQV